MAEPQRATAPAIRLADELTAIRRRGIDAIDLAVGKQGAVEAKELESLATAYCQAKGLTLYGRKAQIARLLQDAVQAYAARGNAADAQLVRSLFFTDDGMPTRDARQASDLLNAAARSRGLTDDAFATERRRVFEEFAGFLLTLAHETPPKQSAVSRRQMLVATAVVLMLALGIAIAVAVTSSGGKTGSTGTTPPPSTGPSGTPALVTGKTYTETSGNAKGSRVFGDPSNLRHEMASIPFMTQVQVSCRKYVPSMPSVTWWYRLASPPYNNQWWSPAVTFLNGDDPAGPYTHDVDVGVAEC